MYFRIVAENVSNRIFNLAQNEGAYRRTILRTVKYIGNTLIIHCRCESPNELARVISTLETDNDAFVSLVENSLGEHIPLKDTLRAKTSYSNGYTLRVAS